MIELTKLFGRRDEEPRKISSWVVKEPLAQFFPGLRRLVFEKLAVRINFLSLVVQLTAGLQLDFDDVRHVLVAKCNKAIAFGNKIVRSYKI